MIGCKVYHSSSRFVWNQFQLSTYLGVRGTVLLEVRIFFVSSPACKVIKLHLLGFCFTPNTSVLIHTPPCCVFGRNRRYLAKTP